MSFFNYCILHTHAEKKETTWCGKAKQPDGWYFQDIDHAAYTLLQRRRLVPCSECLSAIIHTLRKGEENGDSK